jgi:hypothetical protein
VDSIELYPGERVWFSRPQSLEGVEVMHVRGSPRLWKVWHDTYTLCVTYPGGGSGAFWRYRSRDLTIGPGEVMLMEPGTSRSVSRAASPTSTCSSSSRRSSKRSGAISD